MAPEERELVFLSYSRKDKKWLDELQVHLKPYARSGVITAWSDEQIRPGSKWLEAIKDALAKTRVAVLLVSPDFLASDFIHEQELTPILKDAHEAGVTILWIPVRPSSYQKCALRHYQALIDPADPLVKMRRARRDEAYVRICKQIEEALARPATSPAGLSTRETTNHSRPPQTLDELRRSIVGRWRLTYTWPGQDPRTELAQIDEHWGYTVLEGSNKPPHEPPTYRLADPSIDAGGHVGWTKVAQWRREDGGRDRLHEELIVVAEDQMDGHGERGAEHTLRYQRM